MKSTKLTLLSLCFASATLSMAQNPAAYRPAVYPQQQTTAGVAVLGESEAAGTTEYLFKNDVIDAKFVKKDGKLLFGGSKTMDLLPNTELFTVKMGTGGATVVNASDMTLEDVQIVNLTADAKAIKGAHHFDGKQLVATFKYKFGTANMTFTWTAELRDGSHYIKTNLETKTDKEVQMFSIQPMQFNVDVAASGKAAPAPVGDSRLRGRVVSNGKIFALLDTPTAINTAGNDTGSAVEGEVIKTWNDSWEASSWKQVASGEVPFRIIEQNYDYPNVLYKDYEIEVTEAGSVSVEFHYGGVGNHGLNIVGVELTKDGSTSGTYHHGFAGGRESDNVYSVDVQQAGTYTVRMYVENKTEEIDSKGNIKLQLIRRAGEAGAEGEVVPIQGLWSRNTKLAATDTWNVGSVVGIVASEQDRRSVLAYLERERAVPWRPTPIYNSWYELNIDRTNKKTYDYDNLKVEQTVDVLQQWKKNMFDTQGVSIKSFVWDDGWDKYGTWDFNAGFPNGFSEPDVVARQMCSAQGAWLGPCGGYDVAGGQRRNYWSGKGGCNLHNKAYYDVFFNACKRLCEDYEFNYFKFDGISELSPAYGPASGTNGEEDAEGIINIERVIRKEIKPDIFFNTTVGTWASPAWLNISDAVWRHHADHDFAGSNPNSRERWITYRDQYIYLHYVKENPLMTINSMMSHGFMLSNYGGPKNMPKDYDSVLRELRCAFACGSGQVELYADYKLLNEINNGKLWEDMANLIKWQRANADVLPDTHWVGGDPALEQVYGWAAWNGNKAVLSLRNGKNASQTFKFTLRDALNIPEGVNTSITFTKPFTNNQNALTGFTEGQPIDIDTQLSVTLPASSVFMFDGLDGNGSLVLVNDLHFEQSEVHIPAGRAKAPEYVVAPLDASDKTLEWFSDNTDIATVNDGAITGVSEGETTVTARSVDGSDLTMTIKVIVEANVQNDLEKLIEEAQAAYDANEAVTYSDNLITKASQFSSPFSQNDLYPSKPDGGNLSDGVLIDNNGDTFWHTAWSGGDKTDHSHYLQVALDEEVEGTVLLTFTRRNAANDQVTKFDVESSTDGQNFTHADYIEIPNSGAGQTEQKNFFLEQKASHLRFWAENTTNNRGYWHCAEFQLNSVERESVNSEHKADADALLAALTEARKVKEATQEDVDVLDAAYKAYLAALGAPTSVTSVQSSTHDSRIFDLQGRAVNVATKGVFIVNGKKVIR